MELSVQSSLLCPANLLQFEAETFAPGMCPPAFTACLRLGLWAELGPGMPV